MADDGVGRKDAGGYYIMYCCSQCDEKMESKNALQQHMKTCKRAVNTSWIKKEPVEDSTSDRDQVILNTHASTSQANISSCKIKTDPCETSPSSKICSQTSTPQTLDKVDGLKQNNVSQPSRPDQLASCQPQIPQTAVVQTVNTSQSLHVSPVRFPVTLKYSPKYHKANEKMTASEMLCGRMGRKKTTTPNTRTVRSILPKATVVSEAVGEDKTADGMDDSSIPKIEKVYYTSKVDCDPVGQIKVAENAFHPSPLTKEFKFLHSKKHAKNHDTVQNLIDSAMQTGALSNSTAAILKSQRKPEQSVSESDARPQQTIPRTLQPSQGLQYGSQNVQQIPATFFPTPLGLAPAAQPMLPCSQPLLQTQQSVLLNNQNLVQQFLPQNMVFLQPTQTNVLQNPVMLKNETGSPFLPIVTPQQITVQSPPSGINVLPTHPTSVLVPTSTAVTTVSTAPSSQTICSSVATTNDLLHMYTLADKQGVLTPSEKTAIMSSLQNPVTCSAQTKITPSVQTAVTSSVETGVTSSGQNVVKEEKTVIPVPVSLPLTSSSQTMAGTDQLPSSKQTQCQVASDPASTKFVWLPGRISPSGRQHFDPVQSLPPAGGGINTFAPLQQVPGQIINSSNNTGIVLLPPGVESKSVDNTGQLQTGAVNSTLVTSSPGGVNLSANVLAVKQNLQSNVVLLPPMMSQGHILNGIRIASSLSPQNVSVTSTVDTSVKQNLQKCTSTRRPLSPGSVDQPTETQTKDSCASGSQASLLSDSESQKICLSAGKEVPTTKHKDVAPKSVLLCGRRGLTLKVEMIRDCEIGNMGKSESESVIVKFQVRESIGRVHFAIQTVLLPEYKVSQIAQILLLGGVKGHPPVVLDDGRPFLPIAFTGPYIPKVTPTILKKRKSGLPSLNNSNQTYACDFMQDIDALDCTLDELPKESRNTETTIHTIQLCGKVLWLFLDFDGPKILWKLEHAYVIGLPVEHSLPDEVLNEIRVLLSRYRMTIPSCIDPFAVKEGKVNVCNQPQRMITLPLQGDQQTDLEPAVQSTATVSDGPHIHKSAPAKVELREQMDSSSVSGICEPSVPEDVEHRVVQSPQTKETVKSPQLIVRESAEVIQRALEAVVCLERIPLTDSLKKQLKTQSGVQVGKRGGLPLTLDRATKCAKTENAECVYKRRGRKRKKKCSGCDTSTETCEHERKNINSEGRLGKDETSGQGNQREEDITEDTTDIGACENERNGPHTVLESAEIPDNGKGRREAVSLSEWQVLGCEGFRDDPDWTCARQRSGRRCSRSYVSVKSGRQDDVSGVCSSADVRRSYRILCKPKLNYLFQEHQYDYIEDACEKPFSEMGRDTPGKKEKKLNHKLGEKSKSKSIICQSCPHQERGCRSSEEECECGICVDKADGMEKKDTEDVQIDDGHKQETETDDTERSSDSLTSEQFLQKHSDDFQELVLKNAKINRDSEKGIRGHILYLCVICGSFQSRSMDEIVTHLKQHYSGELFCKICQFSAAYKQELIEHEALEHTGKPLYHCDVCQTPFFSQAVFQSHVKRHKAKTSSKPCRKNFPSERAFLLYQDREERKVICHLCNRKFESEDQVRIHYKFCIGGYQCCLCYVKKATVPDIQSHMEEEHGHKGTLSVCNFEHCGACFLTVEELGSHTAMHMTTLG